MCGKWTAPLVMSRGGIGYFVKRLLPLIMAPTSAPMMQATALASLATILEDVQRTLPVRCPFWSVNESCRYAQMSRDQEDELASVRNFILTATVTPLAQYIEPSSSSKPNERVMVLFCLFVIPVRVLIVVLRWLD